MATNIVLFGYSSIRNHTKPVVMWNEMQRALVKLHTRMHTIPCSNDVQKAVTAIRIEGLYH